MKMKTKKLIAGLFMILLFALSANFSTAQDPQEGTFIEESGEKQDSIKKADIFDFDSEFDEGSSIGTGLIIGIAAVVVAGGLIFYFVRKKKKVQA